jgi:hypothetical protein
LKKLNFFPKERKKRWETFFLARSCEINMMKIMKVYKGKEDESRKICSLFEK